MPLHDDCYFIDVDVDVDAYVLSHFLPTGGRFGIFWNNWPFVNLVDRAVSQPVCLFKYSETSIFSPFFHLFNEQKSMSSESLGLQSIFTSPKIAEHIFPEPSFFSSKLGTLPPYTALAPERKRDVSVFENEIYRATTHRCRSDGKMFWIWACLWLVLSSEFTKWIG